MDFPPLNTSKEDNNIYFLNESGGWTGSPAGSRNIKNDILRIEMDIILRFTGDGFVNRCSLIQKIKKIQGY